MYWMQRVPSCGELSPFSLLPGSTGGGLSSVGEPWLDRGRGGAGGRRIGAPM
jgi:hypothetical protein